MSTVYDVINRVDGKGDYLFAFGHPDTLAIEMQILGMKLSDLTGDKLPLPSRDLKGITRKTSASEEEGKVKWHNEDLKRKSYEINTVTSTTVFVLDTAGVVIGQSVRNLTTKQTYLVIDVTGSTITVDAADANAAVGDKLKVTSFGKKYNTVDGYEATRPGLTDEYNFLQYTEATTSFHRNEINLTRYRHMDAKQYVQSRIGDMVREITPEIASTFFFGKRATVVDGSHNRFFAGGMYDYIQTADKITLAGAQSAVIDQIFTQLALAYATGVHKSSIMLRCNQKMISKITNLFTPDVIYNDKLSAVNLNVTVVTIAGLELKLMHSNILEEFTDSTVAEGFMFPLDHVCTWDYSYEVPDANGNVTSTPKNFSMIKRTDNIVEGCTLALHASWSNVFGASGTSAYQHWSFPDA